MKIYRYLIGMAVERGGWVKLRYMKFQNLKRGRRFEEIRREE